PLARQAGAGRDPTVHDGGADPVGHASVGGPGSGVPRVDDRGQSASRQGRGALHEATVPRVVMESKARWAHAGIMLWWILLIALAVWGAVATIGTVRVDGLRRSPDAPIVRQRDRV